MVPNIDWTMGRKIKTRKHPRHGTQCVIQYTTNRNPAQSLQENAITVFGPRLYNSLPKYLRDIGSIRTEKLNLRSKISGAHSWLAKNARPTLSSHQEATSSSTSSLIWGLKEFTEVVESPTRPWSSLSCFETTPSTQVSKYPLLTSITRAGSGLTRWIDEYSHIIMITRYH